MVFCSLFFLGIEFYNKNRFGGFYENQGLGNCRLRNRSDNLSSQEILVFAAYVFTNFSDEGDEYNACIMNMCTFIHRK